MSYRTILVHLDHWDRCRARATLATAWARSHESHLVGVVPTGLYDGVIPAGAIATGTTDFIAQSAQFLRERAEHIAREFRESISGPGALSYEVRLVDAPAIDSVVRHGRTADLIVLGQHDPSAQSDARAVGLAERVLMEAGGPVLFLPYAGRFDAIPGSALVAWDGSRQAAVAVRAAVPALQRCGKVTLVSYLDVDDVDADQRLLLSDVIHFLRRHGIAASAERDVNAVDIDMANAMLSRIADTGADLLVMGGYGHSRFRELMLGGVTRQILAQMTVPVLMAH
ncbi:universal stress protein [Variovorax sp. J22R133]|uniref:universal stress protein n=1 Tax=Variovorax brevis TaxID=3053503 RepID=UPI002575D5EF|nr:universal stress protein [Variovorax sp. J22R133]MDM0116382.1 universal stress protein [Variovorax sp. J22R133]